MLMSCEKPTHIDLFTGIPLEDSALPHHGPDSKPSSCVKQTLFDEQDSPEHGPESPSSRTSESSIGLWPTPYKKDCDQAGSPAKGTTYLTPALKSVGQPSLQPVFPASPQVVPGSSEAREMTVGSGARLYASLEKLNLDTPFLKTLLGSRTWGSTECLLTWKRRATKSGRYSIFQLAASIPRNSGEDCGLWPTATKGDAKESRNKTVNRSNPDSKHHDGTTLTDAARTAMWPTAKKQDGGKNLGGVERAKKEMERIGVGSLDVATHLTMWTTPGTTPPGSPAGTVSFVGRLLTLSTWLMGYQREYLENFWQDSEIPSSPRSQR